MGLTTEKYNQLMRRVETMSLEEIQRNHYTCALEVDRLRKRYEEEVETLLQVWGPALESRRFK